MKPIGSLSAEELADLVCRAPRDAAATSEPHAGGGRYNRRPMSLALPNFSVLLLLARCLAPAPASAADAPPADGPRPLAKLAGPAGSAVAFSRDGKFILTAGGDEARVWDARTFESVEVPIRHAGSLRFVSFSPDGRLALTGANDEARIWDAASGRRLVTVRHGGGIYCASFHPPSERVVTGGADGAARVWDVRSGRQLLAIKHEQPVRFTRFSPDGSMLLTISSEPTNGGRLAVSDAGSGTRLWGSVQDVCLDGRDNSVGSPAAFNPDSTRVAWVGLGAVHLADARRGGPGADRELGWRPFDDTLIEGIDFSPDGMRLLVIGGGACVLDATRKDLPVRAVIETEGIRDAVFSPSGTMILTASVSDRSAVWDTATGNKVIALPPRRLNNPAHVRGGRRSTRFDGRPLVEYESPAIAWSPDGRRVAAGFASDGYTAVWEVPEGKGR